MSSYLQRLDWSTWFASKPEYQYEPLQPASEIRILTLHAADPTSPNLISCHLETVSLDSDVRYTAVSYVWGDPTKRRQILCDKSILHVTVNLYNALRDWRPSDGNIKLWADAICINQKNNTEKSVQVGIMGEIYRRAEDVWVWLGERSETTSRAYRLIDEIYNHFELGNIDNKYILEVIAPWGAEPSENLVSRRHGHVVAALAAMLKVEKELNRNPLAPGDLEDWRALSDLFSLPWFGRKWIIQEVVLAREALIFCGMQSIQWPRLRRVSEVLPTCVTNMTLRNLPNDLPYHLLLPDLNRTPRSATIASTSADTSMLFLLVSTSEFECSDVRDRYFALLSLSSESREADWPVKPDYSYRLTLQDISFRFGKWHLATKRNPEILGYVEPDAQPESRTPSWVPSFGPGHSSVIVGDIGEKTHWQCSGNSILDVQACDTELTLRIKGRTIDSISRLEADSSAIKHQALELWSTIPALNNQSRARLSPSTLTMQSGEETSHWANLTLIQLLQPAIRFRCILHDLVGKVHKFGTEISNRMRIAILDSLTFNIFDPSSKPDPESSNTFLEVLREILQGKPRPETELQGLMQSPRFRALYEGLVCQSRYYCATVKEHIAVVPKVSHVGDKICLFYGCQTPYVIRLGEDGTYRLVGPCYLHGMMQGEAMQMPNVDECFVLR